MHRRTIIVPLDSQAMRELDWNSADPSRLVEYCVEEGAFELLSSSGVFEAVNSACSTMIDDYEDQGLVGEDALLRGNVALMEMFLSASPALRTALSPIIRFFCEAIERGTGVFFFF